MTKRTQGRPPRNSGMNGREKLIEATRTYLQTNRKMSLTRSEIAQGCGVTPALISYYFKDKRSLLEAAIKPLLRSYAAKIDATVQADLPLDERMRGTIGLLIDLSADDAFLVDYMLSGFAAAKLDPEDRGVFDNIHRAIQGLVSELIGSGRWRTLDPLLTEVALWGLCRAFGESVRLQSSVPDGSQLRAGLVSAKVEYICGICAAEAAIGTPAARASATA